MLKFTFRKIDGNSAYCTKRNTEIELESVEFLWKSFSFGEILNLMQTVMVRLSLAHSVQSEPIFVRFGHFFVATRPTSDQTI